MTSEPETLPSDDDSEGLPSDVSEGLPSDVESVHDARAKDNEPSCCSAGCLASVEESRNLKSRVTEIQNALSACTKDQREALQFSCLRAWQCSQVRTWRKYKFCGMPLCCQAVTHILQLPAWKFKNISKQLEEGRIAPDRSLKSSQKQRDKAGMRQANVLLSWLHQNVAESLAETKRTGDKQNADSITLVQKGAASALKKDPLPLAASNVDVFAQFQEDGQQVKWLPPGTTMSEMRDLAQTFVPDNKVSYSTFVLCYHTEWGGRLKVRAEGQHAKCATCARLKEYRRQCHAATDVAKVQAEYSAHIAAVMADRRFDADLNLKALQSVGSVPGTLVSKNASLLSISMDAMDCAKFKVPRHLEAAASKEFTNSWRPELTMIAGIVEGLTEHYMLADQDIVKNADLQCTLIGLLLQESALDLQARGQDMPRHLRIHTDNATGEGKNQTVFYLASWMVKRKLFDSVTLSQFRVGHSHGKPDQRFSEVRWALSQSPVLEDPTFFAEAIRTGVKPREGRALKVHKVGASLEFKKFFEQLQLSTKGHTQTKTKTEQHLEACHVFSFQRRETMAEERKLAIQELDAKHGIAPHSEDVIMSAQLHLADSEDSQAPMVFAAPSDFHKLPAPANIGKSARAAFSTKQVKEFEKTALKISQAPWNLDTGSAYLLKLVTENQENEGDEWVPPDISFLMNGDRATHDDAESSEPAGRFTDETFKFLHTSPAPVTVARPSTRLRQKTAGLAAESNSSPKRPQATAMGGAPAKLFGREGAPSRVAAEPSPNKKSKSLKRPSAAVELHPADKEDTPLASEVEEEVAPMPNLPSESEGLPSEPADADMAPTAHQAAAPKPKANTKAKAKAKTTAKATSKAKAKAKQKPETTGKRKQLGRLPKPEGVKLGCPRCRKSAAGCESCREREGLILNAEQTAWIYKPV